MTTLANTQDVMRSLQEARALTLQDRGRGLAALNDLFRLGRTPDPPPDGRYRGQLVALQLGPLITTVTQKLTARWLPWQGKTFSAAEEHGDNIFTRDSLALARVYWPGYRDYIDDGPQTYRAFRFRTYFAPGLSDPDRQVLKIDYDLDANPRLSVRRVLDELVQLSEGFYLGKAQMHWWWGRWQTVAYFTLNREWDDEGPAPV